MPGLNEAFIEKAALDEFKQLGYGIAYGPDIGPGGIQQERQSYADVLLTRRLDQAIWRLNHDKPKDACFDAVRRLGRRESPSLVLDNRSFHQALVDGVAVDYTLTDG